MGLTNPGRALGRSCLLSISLKLLTLSGIPTISTNSFWLAFLVGLNLYFLIGAPVWFIKITKAVPFESVEVFRKDSFLALYFSLSSLTISRPLCLLPSAALFTPTIWPFGPPPPRSPLRWRPDKELCFDWSADLSTGVILSIRANVRPPSYQWILTKLTSSYSAPASVTFDRTLSFSKHVSSLKAKFLPRLKAFHCISASSWGPFLFCINLFFDSFSLMLHPDDFLCQALPISPNWNAFTERPVAPSPAASHPPLSLFFSISSTSHSDSFYSFIL